MRTEKPMRRPKRKRGIGRYERVLPGYLLVCLSGSTQLHAQGKTDQAQKDLARLAKIRAEREAAQAKRKAEADGALLPLLRTTCLSYDLHPAKAAEVEAKKASGRR